MYKNSEVILSFSELLKKSGDQVLLVAADPYRPAAVDQLKSLGDQLAIPVFTDISLQPAELAKQALKQAKQTGANVLILDTAGRSQIDDDLMEEMRAIEQAVKPDEVYIADLVDNLRSIDGVSDKTIFAVLSECGDIARFKSGQAFIGFLGLYPTLHQSGNTTKYGRLAKRGAKLAKMAIYQASVACVRHNAELKKVYLDKKSSGRAPKECVVVVARKLAMIIYSIYKNNTPYNPARVFSTQASLSH